MRCGAGLGNIYFPFLRRVMRVIGATNGRIPCMTCEYRLTREDMHCQYCRVCGLSISMLNSTKNNFSIALSLGRIVALGKLIRIPSISAIWAWTVPID